MALLQAKNLIKTYQMGQTEVHALKGINLQINKGEFVAITGSSGSGKSTLMHILGCLDTPTSGKLEINGKDISNMSKDELAKIRNKQIGFVFQQFHLLADLTIIDNVALPKLYAGISENIAREDAIKMLKSVGLGDRLKHYPYELSGGQRQRVAIARALINNPSIILADEPTGNLDSATGETILKLFQTLNEKEKVTIIMVTHESYIASKTKRIINLIDGKIKSDEYLSAFFNSNSQLK